MEPHAARKSAEPHAEGRCGAKTKSGGRTCAQPAGWRTDHPGEGKCYLHGGATPIKHGRYSAIQRASLRDRIAKFADDPEPLNLEPEVALLRAFLEDLIERWDAIYGPDGALLAWHESFSAKETPPKPRQLPDFSTVTVLVERVGAMVGRIHKQKAASSISLATLNRVMWAMGEDLLRAVREAELDEDTATQLLTAVEQRWGAIRLDADRARA
ncbi:MAG: hypothetical protein HY011_19035 [Acidobacteria bacterium]|nr:hypothetical protein [Acidobacteriota bacterium]